jgi:hypothetical protein
MDDSDNIRVCIADSAWNPTGTFEEYQERTDAQRSKLEAELGFRLEETSIGTGAACAAFMATIPLLIAAGFWRVLLSGEKLNKSLDGFREVYRKYIKPFLPHEPVVDRNGALVLALKELSERIGEGEHAIQLIAYQRISIRREEAEPEKLHGIEAPEERVEAANIHLFEFKVDGKHARVSVYNTEVKSRLEGENHPIWPNIFPDSSEK